MDRRKRAPTLNINPVAGASLRADTSRRRQTLITILDALHELQDEDFGGDGSARRTLGFDEPSEEPNVDERMQAEGAAAYAEFEARVKELDRGLQKFSHAVARLGSSARLLSSSFALRLRLTRILRLVRDNATELFPRKLRKDVTIGEEPVRDFIRAKLKRPQSNPVLPTSPGEVDPELFPDEVDGLAKDSIDFLECLNEFPEFSDESVNASIKSFEGDLKYWANCLREFKGQFRYPSVTRYVHDLSTELGEHFDYLTRALMLFVDSGVPTIQFLQQHGSENLLNLSTIATFFSAVTATTIQYSFDKDQTVLDSLVNGFWYSSLVFSIASAVNSLIGLTWKQTMYRSPNHRVPWWVLIWIKRSPLIFLVIAVAAFSVGLVLFTYSSKQSLAVCTLVTVFTACSSFGLAAVSSWLIFERWAYVRHEGQKWLDDILGDLHKRLRRNLGFEWAINRLRRMTIFACDAYRCARAASFPTNRFFASYNVDVESIGNDNPNHSGALSLSNPIMLPTTYSAVQAAILPETISTNFGLVSLALSPSEPASPIGVAPTPRPALLRFKNAARAVIMTNRATQTKSLPNAFSHKRLTTHDPSQSLSSDKTSGILTTGRLTRLNNLRIALHSVEPIESMIVHQALARHLAFSPNGNFLATCSWDRTSTIIKVSDLETHRVLAHPNGFVGQVMWSPNGALLLTKLTSGVNVWTVDGVCKLRIDRRTAVQSINWFSDGKTFLSVESSEAVHLNLKGEVLDTYRFERLRLHDVAIASNDQRLFAVATLEVSKDGLQPVKARAENRIVVYNRLDRKIESQVPVLHDVRDITISKDNRFVLVSYEHKTPPQLWRISMVESAGQQPIARLTVAHTYMPDQETDFAGPSYFGGKDDQLILCASKAGDIHIWDRASGALLRHILPTEPGNESLTCIAWNHALDKHMFATGSNEGTIRLWQTSEAYRNPRVGPKSLAAFEQAHYPLSLTEEPEQITAPGGHL